MPADTNAIGERGESLVKTALTRSFGAPLPFFRPQFMGDKYPAIDFFVELVATAGPQTPFFLAQVKTTTTGYMARGNLKVRVPTHKMAALVRYPAPTYIIGVDEVTEVTFIRAAVLGGAKQLPSMPVNHPLAVQNTLQILYDEVLAFWRDCSPAFTTSQFL